jgi:hypothetical protein
VSKALERHFGDGSSVAVQNRVKAMLAEAAVQIRDDLRKQFTADSTTTRSRSTSAPRWPWSSRAPTSTTPACRR